MVANEEDRLAASSTAAVSSLPLLLATTAGGGDHVMMLLLLTYEWCTITTLPPRPGMDSEHFNTTTRTNNSCCLGR